MWEEGCLHSKAANSETISLTRTSEKHLSTANRNGEFAGISLSLTASNTLILWQRETSWSTFSPSKDRSRLLM